LNAKTIFIYSTSYFNLGRLGAFFGGAKPTKAPVATGLGTTVCVHTFQTLIADTKHFWDSHIVLSYAQLVKNKDLYLLGPASNFLWINDNRWF